MGVLSKLIGLSTVIIEEGVALRLYLPIKQHLLYVTRFLYIKTK